MAGETRAREDASARVVVPPVLLEQPADFEASLALWHAGQSSRLLCTSECPNDLANLLRELLNWAVDIMLAVGSAQSDVNRQIALSDLSWDVNFPGRILQERYDAASLGE